MALIERRQRAVDHTHEFAVVISPSWPQWRDWQRRWQYITAWFGVYRAPLALFAMSRVLLLVVTYAGVSLLAPGHVEHRLAGESLPDMLLRWDAWDARWFSGIAAAGYGGYQPGASSAFFPLMPLLTHIAGAPFAAHYGPTAYFAAGMVVANTTFLGALLVLYRLTLDLTESTIAAQRAMLYLSLFPTALFAFTAYSESLFLLLCVASYLCMRRGHWLPAGILAGCATATRFFGVALAVPFLIELIQQHGRDWRAWLRNGWSLLCIPLAVGAYALYLWRAIGDPLGFWHAEIHWHRQFLEPAQTLWIALTTVGQLPFGSTHQFNEIVDLLVVALDLGLLLYALTPHGREKLALPPSLLLFGIVLLLIPLSDPFVGYLPDFIASTTRFAFTIFPAFIVLAQLLRNRPTWHEIALIASTCLLVIYSLGFILGDYVI